MKRKLFQLLLWRNSGKGNIQGCIISEAFWFGSSFVYLSKLLPKRFGSTPLLDCEFSEWNVNALNCKNILWNFCSCNLWDFCDIVLGVQLCRLSSFLFPLNCTWWFTSFSLFDCCKQKLKWRWGFARSSKIFSCGKMAAKVDSHVKSRWISSVVNRHRKL